MSRLKFSVKTSVRYGGYLFIPGENMECEIPSSLDTPSNISEMNLRFRGIAEVITDETQVQSVDDNPEVQDTVESEIPSDANEVNSVDNTEENSVDDSESNQPESTDNTEETQSDTSSEGTDSTQSEG